MANLPYAAASPDKLGEIVREAELRLAAQLTLGIAADQRAMTFAGFLAAIDAASIAALVSMDRGSAFKVTLIELAIGFGIAALLAIWSAQPVAWDVAGSAPSDWRDDISVDSDPMHDCMAAMAGHYDDMIELNARALKAGALPIRLALLVIMATLVIAAVTTLLVA